MSDQLRVHIPTEEIPERENMAPREVALARMLADDFEPKAVITVGKAVLTRSKREGNVWHVHVDGQYITSLNVASLTTSEEIETVAKTAVAAADDGDDEDEGERERRRMYR